jgi:hypothetical protein
VGPRDGLDTEAKEKIFSPLMMATVGARNADKAIVKPVVGSCGVCVLQEIGVRRVDLY